MSYIRYIIHFILFWLIYFLVNRILFVLFFIPEVSSSNFFEVIRIIPNSLALDISFLSYMLSIICIILWLGLFIKPKRFMQNIIYFFTVFMLFLSSIIAGGEVALYSEWNTKLNFKALSHLSAPSEVFQTASMKHFFILFIFLVGTSFFIFLYKKKVHILLKDQSSISVIKRFFVLPLFLGLLFIGARGGLQAIPINLSDAYFSNNIILNDIAVNSNWNIIQSFLKNSRNLEGNPYQKHSDQDALDFMNNINTSSGDSVDLVLTNKKPNLVFILLESWSADNIESLEGLEGITPNFRSLEKQGLLFTDFYSNGWTSDQSVSSIFSSFPVFPYVAIINQADKSRRLPCLNRSLDAYHSSFFFGGQLTYGNIKGYLLSQGFDLVKDKNDYKDLPSGRLGVHDQYMFNQFKKEIGQLPEPFLTTLFTLSSHSPYDFPAEHKLSFDSKHDQYVNSVAYTDKCLGEFMQSVKEEGWYDNTLFIIVADHSHSSPIKRRIAQKERYKIPMLWIGEVLKEEFRGEHHSRMGSQLDLTPSILSQLNMSHSDYIFGNDLFNCQNDVFIPYAFHKGYGLISENGYYAFSETYNKIIESHPKDRVSKSHIQKEAELYFQIAFQKYLDL